MRVGAFDNDCSTTDGGMLASETSWLAQDLGHDHSACTLAYWHQPSFSSTAKPFTSDSTEGAAAGAWWKLLHQHRATLILNGHDHLYSRFAPMDPAGNADPRSTESVSSSWAPAERASTQCSRTRRTSRPGRISTTAS